MVWFSGAKEESIDELIARKKYGRAVERLLAQFKEGSRDPRVRMQLSDVLVLSGKGKQAIPVLQGLADEFALEGFAAKAIAVLKKIDKIEPGRADVERKLATLIEKKRQDAPSTDSMRIAAPPPGAPELGIEEIETEPLAEPRAAAVTLGDAESMVEEDLLGAIQETLSTGVAPAPGARPEAPMVESPLFSDFNQDELLAVIHGLELQTFQPGDIIITQGEPGDSLFILTTGRANAWVKNAEGRHVKVREMTEGAFFGEISILTAQPRTATVTAASLCELLELHRPTLDSIVASHPRVWDVLNEFYRQRVQNA